MTHRSRLAGFIIDCQTGDIDAAADFWAGALGFAIGGKQVEGDARYVEFQANASGLHIEVQQVAHASRVHLDIETDDLDAEAARLETLGARKVGFVKRWWVMEAPTGQRFCVVRMKHPEQGATPNEWP